MKPKDIIAVVADHYRLTPRDLTMRDRSSPKAEARQVAMYLTFSSRPDWNDVSRAFRRDRGTVRHAIEVVSARMDTEKKFRARVTEIAVSLGVPV